MEFLSNNFISEFFVIALKWLFGIIQNYSVAIIILTIAIRLLILPLDLRQKQSTRKMSLIQPKLESMKKRYANNPQQLQKKQKELYAKEGVKPLAGCLPMLITLPIFFAFFGAMRALAAEQTVSLILNAHSLGAEAYDLPQWLWVHNFWQPDSGLANILQQGPEFISFLHQNSTSVSPQSLSMLQDAGLISYGADGLVATSEYTKLTADILSVNNLTGFKNGWFILPIFAGGTLFLQQKITMAQNPQQQQQGKMMLYFFPIFSIYICTISNAAFSIYWLFANIYALAQTLVLNLIYKKRDEKAKAGLIKEES